MFLFFFFFFFFFFTSEKILRTPPLQLLLFLYAIRKFAFVSKRGRVRKNFSFPSFLFFFPPSFFFSRFGKERPSEEQAILFPPNIPYYIHLRVFFIFFLFFFLRVYVCVCVCVYVCVWIPRSVHNSR